MGQSVSLYPDPRGPSSEGDAEDGFLPSVVPDFSNLSPLFLDAGGQDGGAKEASSRDPSFPDLSSLPPELALQVLSKLNATDLCLAACVWQKLASDEILWQGLCKEQWPGASVYRRERPMPFKKVYLRLDEGTLTFNSDPEKGMSYFFRHGLVRDDCSDVAQFIHSTKTLSKAQVRRYLQRRPDVLECLVTMHDYGSQFLPNALRKCFAKLEAPEDRGPYLQGLLAAFSKRFCQCNPHLGYNADTVYVMCFSLILLSVDLTSPHVKNKMSKREFIRNTRNAVPVDNAGQGNNNDRSSRDELLGEMYDNVFVRGHVSSGAADAARGATGAGASLWSWSNPGAAIPRPAQHQNFIPGYLALFL